jgi:hypothetical protein
MIEKHRVYMRNPDRIAIRCSREYLFVGPGGRATEMADSSECPIRNCSLGFLEGLDRVNEKKRVCTVLQITGSAPNQYSNGSGSEAEIHGTGTASTQCSDSSPSVRHLSAAYPGHMAYILFRRHS